MVVNMRKIYKCPFLYYIYVNLIYSGGCKVYDAEDSFIKEEPWKEKIQ